METPELDILIDELETRVERLRALYEQYFLGIEKIPPQVAQKDVDRRLYTLRREQIRNTARRFKLQTIIQRYNTFQQYWMRIMREIENGTYRRHVLRAERTVGTVDLLTAAERKRAALPERELGTVTNEPTDDATAGASLAEVLSPEAGQLPPAPPIAAASTDESRLANPAQSATAIRAQIEKDLGLLLDDDLDGLDTHGLAELGTALDDPLLSSMPPPLHRKPSAKPIARRSTRPNGERKRSQAPARPQSKPSPSSAKSSAEPVTPRRPGPLPASPMQSAVAQAPRSSLRPAKGVPSSASQATQGGLRLPASSAVAGRGLPPLQRTGTPRGAPPRIPSSPIIAIEGKPQVPPGAAAPPGKQLREATAEQTKAMPTATQRDVSPAPPPTRPEIPSATKPQPPPRPEIPPAAKPLTATQPEVSFATKPHQPPPRLGGAPLGQPQPAARPQSMKPAASPQTSASGGGSPGGLDRNRVERIAEKLRDARKLTNEESPVSVDALAKKLETTAAQLREKHKGKQVDFDVVIKDGKAIVKPIVR